MIKTIPVEAVQEALNLSTPEQTHYSIRLEEEGFVIKVVAHVAGTFVYQSLETTVPYDQPGRLRWEAEYLISRAYNLVSNHARGAPRASI